MKESLVIKNKKSISTTNIFFFAFREQIKQIINVNMFDRISDSAMLMIIKMHNLILEGHNNGILIKPDNIGFVKNKAVAWSVKSQPRFKKWTVCSKPVLEKILNEVNRRLHKQFYK